MLYKFVIFHITGSKRKKNYISTFQAKKLEANIEMTRKEMEDPTDLEIELRRRLSQMTDHLIQKQAQVCYFWSFMGPFNIRCASLHVQVNCLLIGK